MRIALHIMIALIVTVAVYDIHCTVALHDTLIEHEQNPVALWLVHRTESLVHVNDPRSNAAKTPILIRTVDVSRLVTAKVCGLAVSIPIMIAVIRTQRPPVAASVLMPVSFAALMLLARLVL